MVRLRDGPVSLKSEEWLNQQVTRATVQCDLKGAPKWPCVQGSRLLWYLRWSLWKLIICVNAWCLQRLWVQIHVYYFGERRYFLWIHQLLKQDQFIKLFNLGRKSWRKTLKVTLSRGHHKAQGREWHKRRRKDSPERCLGITGWAGRISARWMNAKDSASLD